MNIQLLNEVAEKVEKDLCSPNEDAENRNIVCNGDLEGNDENNVDNNSKSIPTTKIIANKESDVPLKLNTSSQKVDTLTRTETNAQHKILENKGFCGHIGFRARINEVIKKPNLSILRGPHDDIPHLSLMEYFQKQFSEESFDAFQIAFITSDTKTKMTFASLNKSSNVIATRLRELLIKSENQNKNKDIVIAVCLTPDLRYRISIILAILKIGATYLPINHDYPEDKVSVILNECKVIASILSRSDSRAMDVFQNFENNEVTGQLIFIENLCKSIIESSTDKDTEFSPKDILEAENSAYPQPKNRVVCILPSFNGVLGDVSKNGIFSGIRYHSRTILNLLHWERKTFPYERNKTSLAINFFVDSPDCIEAIKELFFPLLTGQTLVIFKNQNTLIDPVHFLAYMKAYQVTKMVVYPRLLQHILYNAEMMGMTISRDAFSFLKVCFCIGESISIELATLFFHYVGDNKQLVILYGHAENTSTVTHQIYESLDDLREMEYCNYLAAGTPISNYKLYIVNQSVELVQKGVVGEICLSGPIVNEMCLYGDLVAFSKLKINTFTKSNSLDFQFLLRTGDYGRIVDNRLVYEVGRNKHVYIDEHYFNVDEVTELLNNWHHLMNSYHIFLCYQLDFDCIPKLILFVDFKGNSEYQNCKAAIDFYLKKKLPKWAIPEIISITSVDQASLSDNNDNGIITTLLEEYEAQKKIKREFSDWKSLNLISPEEIKATKVLLLLLSNMLPLSVQEMANNLSKSIFNLGATSFIALKIAQQLNKIGYHVSVYDVNESKSLLELTSKMIDQVSTTGIIELNLTFPKILDSYKLEVTTEDHKREVIEVLAHSYTRKDTLDYFCQVHPKEVKKLLEKQWRTFIKGPSSLTLKRLKDKKIVGAILGLDWSHRKQIKTGISQAISHRLKLQRYLEEGFSIANDKPKEGKPVRAFQIAHFGLLSNLFNLSELYEITNKMIGDTIQLAKSQKYTTILMTVYDLYVAELCEVVWGFTLIRECQANKVFTDDDKEPYAEAPDSLICKFMKMEL